MMNEYLEKEIITALDEISMDEMAKKMENVNPQEFKCPDELVHKRIERNVMKKMKQNKRKKTSTYKKIGYTAAAVAMLAGSTFVFGDSVRASLKKMFTFIPDRGVVEVDVNDTEGTDGKNTATLSGGYVLKESVKKEMPAFEVSMESASIVDNKMKMIYTIDLKAVREAALAGPSDESLIECSEDLMVKEFKAAGMEQYCDYNEDANPIIKSVKSHLNVNGKELQSTSSEVKFGEDSAFIAYVIEEYALDDVDATNAEIALQIGDVDIPFSMVSLDVFDTVDGATAEKFVTKNVGMTLVCDATKHEDGWLYADIYVMDSGKYLGVDSLWPDMYDDDEISNLADFYPYAMINGEKVMGGSNACEVFDGKDGMPFRLVFDAEENVDMSTLSIYLPTLMVVTEEGKDEFDNPIVVRLENDFVFGADAGSVKEQSADEAVETSGEAITAWEEPLAAEPLTSEDEAIFERYETQLANQGLEYSEYSSDSMSYVREDGQEQYRICLILSDTDDGNNKMSAFVYKESKDESEWQASMKANGCTIENTEYGMKAEDAMGRIYEYHGDDHIVIEIIDFTKMNSEG